MRLQPGWMGVPCPEAQTAGRKLSQRKETEAHVSVLEILSLRRCRRSWVRAGDLSVGAVHSEVGCDLVGVGACMGGRGFQAWAPGNCSVWRSVRGEAPSTQINPMGEATSCPR